LKLSREIKTTFLVIGGVLLFVFGFSFLKGKSFFEKDKIIYTVYDEVEGLLEGAKVTINGLVIGKIMKIDFLPNTTRILITMSVRNELDFSPQSEAILYEAGLIGGKAIQIDPVFDSKSIVKSGDTLVSALKPGLTELINKQIEPLQLKIENMLTSADSLFIGVGNILNNDSQENLKSILKNLSLSTSKINDASISLVEILKKNQSNIDNTFENFAETSDNLKTITDSISQANLAVAINKFTNTIESLDGIVATIESGNGTMGKLVKDETLYQNLSQASKELEDLLSDLKSHPKRYVHFSLFGKKDKEEKSKENNK
jgi:phospholipid/cholesterol/gamma-HCH transport system substrate-binding protein|tara:strand:- start:2201 stop:3148 length:948 start_codon:yes stop_codon:yes gene_type:complete